MANLSFAQFIEQQDTIKHKTTYAFSKDISVSPLYSDYVSWLKQCSRRSSTPYRFTATEMLTQLQIINNYVHFIVEHYKKTTTLEKPLKLLPVPENLTAHHTQAHHFELPPSNHITHDQIKFASSKFWKHTKLNTYVFALFAAVLSIYPALMAFVPGSTLVAQTIGFFLFTFCATLSLKLFFTDGAFYLNSHTFVTRQNSTAGKVLFASTALVMAYTVGLFVLAAPSPLLFICAALFQLPFSLVLSSRIHNKLNKILWSDFRESMPEEVEQVLMPSHSQVASLVSSLQNPEQTNTWRLSNAISTTTHCLLTSRLERQISYESPATEIDDEISIDHLAYTLKKR